MFLMFPAVAMSLGWGLRGFIGGGPLGAMIPGALVAIALAFVLDREPREAAVIAALGAVGIGFGGQMTYGQTVGFTFRPETFWWGILGLSLKGAIWGLLGGAVLGVALVRRRYARKDVYTGFGLMVLGTWLGWKLINQPKLIYFSNRLDRPREEVWTGLLIGALVLLAYLAVRGGVRIPLRFGLWGALGGIVGFGGGCWAQIVVLVPHLATHWVDRWKIVECFFGFCFGLALAFCAYRLRGELKGVPEREDRVTRTAFIFVNAILLVATFALLFGIHARIIYTIVGALLMIIALQWENSAWQTAVTITYCATALDLRRNLYFDKAVISDPILLLVFVIVSTIIVGYLAYRWKGNVERMFLLLTWSTVTVSALKSFIRPAPVTLERIGGQGITQLVFTMMAIWLTWFTQRRLRGMRSH